MLWFGRRRIAPRRAAHHDDDGDAHGDEHQNKNFISIHEQHPVRLRARRGFVTARQWNGGNGRRRRVSARRSAPACRSRRRRVPWLRIVRGFGGETRPCDGRGL